MKNTIKIQLLILSALLIYPLLFSILSKKEVLRFYHYPFTIEIIHAGIYTQWSVFKFEKLLHIRGAIRYKITNRKSIYIIVERQDIINGRLQRAIIRDKTLASFFGDYNPFVTVAYYDSHAKIKSFNEKINTFYSIPLQPEH